MKDYLLNIKGLQDLPSYLREVRAFVLDPNFSPSNWEDLLVFESLMLFTKFGKNHIHFYVDLLSKLSYQNYTDSLKIFARYLEYLSELSSALMLDALNYFFDLLIGKDKLFASTVGNHFFLSLNDYLKEEVLNLRFNSEFIHELSKVKLYKTFY